jgi:S-formylglutathione hydrolase FrmB
MAGARAKRARRLLPALVATFLSAVAAAPAGAAQPDLRDGAGLEVLSQEKLSARLLTTSVGTEALPGPANVRILLPPGYGRDRGRRYPVLYLLHGTSGGAPDWTEAGDAAKTTRRLGAIVVMPDIALNRDGGGWCTNWPNGEYEWETFHVSQLVPWVDRNLATVRNRRGRAIAGLSQGGFCSTSYAARHPDLFSSTFSYSGAPDIASRPETILGATTIINATEVGLNGDPPNTMFGDRVTNEVNWKAHDPATLIENLRHTRIQLYTGNGLPGPLDSQNPVDIPGMLSSSAIEALVHEDTTYFHQRLDQIGKRHYFNDYGPGTHAFGYWARDLRWSRKQLRKGFAHPPKRPRAVTHTSADDAYSVYGWKVAMNRTAREFSTLEDARCRSFTLAGSGSATVRTPRCLRPRQRYRVELSGEEAGDSALTARASRRGQLKLTVELGPANPFQQYTAQAEIAGTDVFRTTVRITSK